jgi:hypothetical protein
MLLLLVGVVGLLLMQIMDQVGLDLVDIELEQRHFLVHLVFLLMLVVEDLALLMVPEVVLKELILHLHSPQEQLLQLEVVPEVDMDQSKHLGLIPEMVDLVAVLVDIIMQPQLVLEIVHLYLHHKEIRVDKEVELLVYLVGLVVVEEEPVPLDLTEQLQMVELVVLVVLAFNFQQHLEIHLLL